MNSIEDIFYRFFNKTKLLRISNIKIIGWVYKRLPNFLKYGSFYKKYLCRLKQNNKCDPTIYLEKKDQINYYSKIEINRFDEFPIIDKSTVRNNFDDFIIKNEFKNAIPVNTGGNSGKPFEFYINSGRTRPKEKAHFDWYWNKWGYCDEKKVLMVRGKPLIEDRLLEKQPAFNRLALSCYRINQRNISSIVKEIENFKPNFIHAYPSSLKVITDLLCKANISLDINPEAIFLGSEFLPGSYKIKFKEYFKCDVVNWYGHSESLIHGGFLPGCEKYHFFGEYGYVELLDKKGEAVQTKGSEGRIVATGFDNSVMPLIRYDTEDVGVLFSQTECSCGFKGVVLEAIKGRDQDFIYLSNGVKVSLTAFYFGQHFEENYKVKNLQIEQNEFGKIILRIHLHEDESKIKKMPMQMIESVGKENLSINVQYVQNIERTRRGKQRFLIQNLTK